MEGGNTMEEREKNMAWHGKRGFCEMTVPGEQSGDALHEPDIAEQISERLRCEEQESSEILKMYLHGLGNCAGKRKKRRNISQGLKR
jgi:hypothetical protein